MVLHGDSSAAQVSCRAEPKLTAPWFWFRKNLGHVLRQIDDVSDRDKSVLVCNRDLHT
jgi:hypothetical protein